MGPRISLGVRCASSNPAIRRPQAAGNRPQNGLPIPEAASCRCATVGFRWWQLVTCAFLHGNTLHIALNMYLVYLFGHDVERMLGARYYLALYFVAVITASSVQLGIVTATVSSGVHPTLGASGGVFRHPPCFRNAIPVPQNLLSCCLQLYLPAWLFVTLCGAIELTSGVLGTGAGIAHFAHLGGMLGGYLVLRRHWRRRAP
jgi:membrane associated rhomboid family serine protease